jgi:hypothetical protein
MPWVAVAARALGGRRRAPLGGCHHAPWVAVAARTLGGRRGATRAERRQDEPPLQPCWPLGRAFNLRMG